MRTLQIASAMIVCVQTLAARDANSVRSDFSFKPQSTDGIVIISVTQDEPAGGRAMAIFYLDYHLTSGKAQMLTSLHQPVPGIWGSSDFDDGQGPGQVLVLALPAGKHKIDTWQIESGFLRIHPKEHPTPLAFEVVPGEIKYVGNLHANLRNGKNILGMTRVANGYPEVRDERNRDVSMIDAKYPQFRGTVVYELLPLGPWMVGAGTRQQIDPLSLHKLPPPRTEVEQAASTSCTGPSSSHASPNSQGALFEIAEESRPQVRVQEIQNSQ